MRDYEFCGVIGKHSRHCGKNIEEAIINTLDLYEGESDEVVMELYIIPKNSDGDHNDRLMRVDIRWEEDNDGWLVLGYR